jgi:hypothetical protein
MYFVVNGKGQFWNGFSWGGEGRSFWSEARATRSLYEQGEDLDYAIILSDTQIAELREMAVA